MYAWFPMEAFNIKQLGTLNSHEIATFVNKPCQMESYVRSCNRTASVV
jgi:hypothetical protein